jgi:hypothetical protein
MIFRLIDSYDLIRACSLVSKKWFSIIERSNRLRLCIARIPRNILPSLLPLCRSYKSLQISLPNETSINATPQFQTILEDLQNLHVRETESVQTLFDFLKQCKKLQCFMFFCPISSNLSRLSQLPLLRELYLVGMGIHNSVVSLDTLGPLTRLQKLELDDLEINDESMQQVIKSMPNLEYLELFNVRGLTSAGFLNGNGLGALNRLHTLFLPASVITDDVVGKMKLPRLRKLCLFKQNVRPLREITLTTNLY